MTRLRNALVLGLLLVSFAGTALAAAPIRDAADLVEVYERDV